MTSQQSVGDDTRGPSASSGPYGSLGDSPAALASQGLGYMQSAPPTAETRAALLQTAQALASEAPPESKAAVAEKLKAIASDLPPEALAALSAAGANFADGPPNIDELKRKLASEGLPPELAAKLAQTQGVPIELLTALPAIRAQNEQLQNLAVLGQKLEVFHENARQKWQLNAFVHLTLILLLIVLGFVEGGMTGACAVIAGVLLMISFGVTAMATYKPIETLDALKPLRQLEVLILSDADMDDIAENGPRAEKLIAVRDSIDAEEIRVAAGHLKRVRDMAIELPKLIRNLGIGNTTAWIVAGVICVIGGASGGGFLSVVLIILGSVLLIDGVLAVCLLTFGMRLLGHVYEKEETQKLLNDIGEMDSHIEKLLDEVLKPLIDYIGDLDVSQSKTDDMKRKLLA